MDSTLEAPPLTTTPRRSWLVALVWLVTMGFLAASVVMNLAAGVPGEGGQFVLFLLLVGVTVGSSATVGALLAVRVPSNVIGWIFLGSALVISQALLVQAAVARSIERGPVAVELLVLAHLSTTLFVPAVVSIGLVVLVFPDGRLPRWGRGVLGVVVLGLVLIAIHDLLMPRQLFEDPRMANPMGQPGLAELLGLFEAIGSMLLVTGLVLSTLLLMNRYRSAGEVERKQIQWFAYVAVVLAASIALGSLEAAGISEIAWLVAFAALAALPVAIGLAVLRYRLYDIGLIISRTLVYVPLLALLAGVFAAGVTFFERLFLALTGEETDLSIVLTTLLVATVFDPLRRRLEEVVDSHFKPSAVTPAVAGSTGQPIVLDDLSLEEYVESVVRRVMAEQSQNERQRSDP